jgi:hypothetical protein
VGLREFVSGVRQDSEDWAEGKSWFWRILLLCYLIYGGFRHLTDSEYNSLLGGITLGIHELGHILFSFDGTFLMIAGGTLCQLAAPLAAAVVFFRQQDYFGTAFAGAWLAFSSFNVATYVADARDQKLPLLGLSSDPIHDWNYMLGRLHLLPYDTTIARFIRISGFLLLAASLYFAGWLCWRMFNSDSRPAIQ